VTRSGFDPRALEDGQPITLEHLKMLAAVTNGRCGVLLNSGYPWKESLDPDVTDIANEETV